MDSGWFRVGLAWLRVGLGGVLGWCTLPQTNMEAPRTKSFKGVLGASMLVWGRVGSVQKD